MQVHTPDEHIAVADLERMVAVTLELVELARQAECLASAGATVTAVTERLEGLVRLEVDGRPCVAYPRLTGPVALGDDVVVNVQAVELGLGLGRLRRPPREPHPRARPSPRSRARM